MSLDTELAPNPASVKSAATISTSDEFVNYCEAEFERRRNSGEEFDEASYREAMEMALTRVRQLEDEGLA